MFNAKSDVVRHLSFISDIQRRVKGYGFFKNTDEYDLCGVVFAGQWAYATNGHFFIRVRIPDRQPGGTVLFELKGESITQSEDVLLQVISREKAAGGLTHIFYRYEDDLWDTVTFTQPERLNIHMFHGFFMDWKDQMFVFNRKEFIDQMDLIFKNSWAEKMRKFVAIIPDISNMSLEFKFYNMTKEAKEKERSFAIKLILPAKNIMNPSLNDKEPILLQSFYLYELMAAFEGQSDFVSMHYNTVTDPDNPGSVTMKMYDPTTGWTNGDISVALGLIVQPYTIVF